MADRKYWSREKSSPPIQGPAKREFGKPLLGSTLLTFTVAEAALIW
jgi:hypothetical protein